MFSTFLTKEYSSSNNVKDKVNKLSIQRLLRILQTYFSTYQTIPPNGICCFVGIDNSNNEITNIFEPKLIATRFIYSCGKHFDYDAVVSAYKSPECNSKSYVATITGDETRIYSYADNIFTPIYLINGLLIKRHRKGGQSSVRFSRLAEESRTLYSTRIVDKINTLTNCLLVGSDEIIQRVKSNAKLLCNIKLKLDVIIPNYLNLNKKEIIKLLDSTECNDKLFEEVSQLVDKDPDMLAFGEDIDLNSCEYIITTDVEEKDLPKRILLPPDSKYYSKLFRFEKIGKLYF